MLSSPRQEIWQVTIAGKKYSTLECAIINCCVMPQLCEIKLYTFNQLPSCGLPNGPIILTTTPMSPSQVLRGKIQGNSICAADPSSASVMPTLLSSDSTFEHNPRAFTTTSGGRNNYVNVLLGHVGRREKYPLHYQPKECRGRFAASWPRTSTEMLSASWTTTGSAICRPNNRCSMDHNQRW